MGVVSHHWPARCARLVRTGLGADVVTTGNQGRVGVASDRFFKHEAAAVSAPGVERNTSARWFGNLQRIDSASQGSIRSYRRENRASGLLDIVAKTPGAGRNGGTAVVCVPDERRSVPVLGFHGDSQVTGIGSQDIGQPQAAKPQRRGAGNRRCRGACYTIQVQRQDIDHHTCGRCECRRARNTMPCSDRGNTRGPRARRCRS